MEEGTILRWLKSVGEEVHRGDELVEIETDKANMTYESLDDGVLVEVVAAEGDTLPIGEVIARIGSSDEMNGAAPQQDEAPAKEEAVEKSAVGSRQSAERPRPRQTAEEAGDRSRQVESLRAREGFARCSPDGSRIEVQSNRFAARGPAGGSSKQMSKRQRVRRLKRRSRQNLPTPDCRLPTPPLRHPTTPRARFKS